MILGEFFDKIYCINLERRVDRWNETKLELEKFDLNRYVTRYVAIDGCNINSDIKEGSPLLDGELGLLMTHINIIMDSIDNNYKNILILEDDVIFTDDMFRISELIPLIPSNWDMIYFGGNHNINAGSNLTYVNESIIKLHNTFTTHCIGINNTVFESILNLLNGKSKQVDVYYRDMQSTNNCYGIFPSIATQRPGYSDIQNKVVNYGNMIK